MTAQNEGYKIMPPMDPKYTERSGLEGPFTTLSGKVVYYDPKEGSYYDPDTDMYMSYDEFRRYDDDYKGMKDERDEVEETLSPKEKKLVAKMYNKDGTLTDLGKRVMGTKESRTLENLMAKVFGKTVNEFEFNPNAGHRDQMSHPENRGLGAEPNRSYSPRPKLRPKNLKAPMTSPRPKARPKDLEMKYAINKAVKQAVGESQFDGHDIMSEDPPNGIDFDYANLSKVNWEQYSEEDIKTFYSIVDNLSFESGYYNDGEFDDSHFNALQWLEKNVMNKTEAQFEEGHSPHKKGSAKYKAHMAVGEDMHDVDEHKMLAKHLMDMAKEDDADEYGMDGYYFREVARAVMGHDPMEIRAAILDGDTSPREQVLDHIAQQHPDLLKEIFPRDAGKEPYLATMREGEENHYLCVHAQKGSMKCTAGSSYEAAKKAAAQWKMKSTAGIDAHLIGDEPKTATEGHSPHKKGSAKYKAHMAAKHASMNEGKEKPKVSVNEMQDALKLKDAPSNEHVVASYVRTMIDESHKTWDDVMEQVEFVLDLVKEGKTMKAEDVFNIVKSQHMQSYFDYKMSLKENLDTLRNIVKDKAYQTVKFEDGSMKVDLTTASMFLQVFDAQKPETQEKIQAKIKTKQGFLAMLDLIYSKM
jgi:hypothetical protein